MLRPLLVALALIAAPAALAQQKYVGTYLLIDAQGVEKLQALAGAASTLPFNRLWVSFFT